MFKTPAKTASTSHYHNSNWKLWWARSNSHHWLFWTSMHQTLHEKIPNLVVAGILVLSAIVLNWYCWDTHLVCWLFIRSSNQSWEGTFLLILWNGLTLHKYFRNIYNWCKVLHDMYHACYILCPCRSSSSTLMMMKNNEKNVIHLGDQYIADGLLDLELYWG